MKKTILGILTGILYAFSAMAQQYVIEGHITDMPKDSQIYLTKSFYGGEQLRVDSVFSENGHFTFKGNTVDDHHLYVIQVKDRFTGLATLFLEPGHITLKGKWYGMNYAKGTALNNSYAKYMGAMNVLQSDLANLHYKLRLDSTLTAENRADIERRMENLENSVQYVNDAFLMQHRNDWLGIRVMKDIAPRSSIADLENRLSFFEPTVLSTNTDLIEIQKQLQLMKSVAVGNPIGDFSLPDIQGKTIKLSDYKGKYVLLDFWASWCAPCRAENPNLIKAYNKFPKDKFVIIGVSLDKKHQAWIDAVRNDGLPYTNVIDQTGKYAEQYSIRTIPQSYLINPQGIIVAKDLRSEELQKVLSEYLLNAKGN